MSTPHPTTKVYSVTLVARDEWQILLPAKSAEEAEAEGIRILIEEGTADFKHRGGGIVHVEVWKEEP